MALKKKRLAIYPGTFDPVTNGHLDILHRASILFDEVIIGVVENPTKKTLFDAAHRVNLINKSLINCHFKCPVRVESFEGLLVRFAKKNKAYALVRGLRAVSDFDYEFQMALMNRHQAPDIETVYLMPDEKYVYLSSSMIKAVARHKGNLGSFLPKPVINALFKKFPDLK
ncbi:pantetheine-phosphate adenylyltransferase [bacterium F11]|nr:pantetheine-phosphate adenylyltransferase [bacterium F11]